MRQDLIEQAVTALSIPDLEECRRLQSVLTLQERLYACGVMQDEHDDAARSVVSMRTIHPGVALIVSGL